MKQSYRSEAASNRLIADIIVGPGLIMMAGWPLLYLYAFASMTDPRLPRSERYAQLFQQLFLTETVVAVVPLIVAFLFGCFRCLRAVKEILMPSIDRESQPIAKKS